MKKILIAEDDATTREMLIAAMHTWNYEPVPVSNGQDALRILQSEDAPRLAVLDCIMPELSGPEVCAAMRRSKSKTYSYLVLLTTQVGTAACVEGLGAGADDFLSKPYVPEELRLRLRTGERVLTLQDQLQARHAAVQKKLERDSLTGVASREALMDAFRGECNRSERLDTVCAVLMIDVDNFKDTNDQHGHIAGDQALRHIGGILQDNTRPYDTCGRYGGDEFLLILPNATTDGAMTIAQRICRAAAESPLQVGNQTIHLSLSIGAAASEKHGLGEPLLIAADQALYHAKNTGRNQAVPSV